MRRACGHDEYIAIQHPAGLDDASARLRKELRRWIRALAARPCAACRRAALRPIRYRLDGRPGSWDPQRDQWTGWDATFLARVMPGPGGVYSPSPDGIPAARMRALAGDLGRHARANLIDVRVAIDLTVHPLDRVAETGRELQRMETPLPRNSQRRGFDRERHHAGGQPLRKEAETSRRFEFAPEDIVRFTGGRK